MGKYYTCVRSYAGKTGVDRAVSDLFSIHKQGQRLIETCSLDNNSAGAAKEASVACIYERGKSIRTFGGGANSLGS